MKHVPAIFTDQFEQIILNQAKHDMFQSCSHSEHDNVQSHLTGLTFLDD